MTCRSCKDFSRIWHNARFCSKQNYRKHRLVSDDRQKNLCNCSKRKDKKSKITKDTNIIALELSVSNKIGLNVEIQNSKRNKGKISFEYKDLRSVKQNNRGG